MSTVQFVRATKAVQYDGTNQPEIEDFARTAIDPEATVSTDDGLLSVSTDIGSAELATGDWLTNSLPIAIAGPEFADQCYVIPS